MEKPWAIQKVIEMKASQVFLGAPSFTMVVVQVRQVKLVGELYNYRLVDSVLVFDSLYQWGFPGRTTAPSIQFMLHAS